MLAIRLDRDLEHRLACLAVRMKRTKASTAREAIIARIEDIEDIWIAEQRLLALREGRDRTLSSEEVSVTSTWKILTNDRFPRPSRQPSL